MWSFFGFNRFKSIKALYTLSYEVFYTKDDGATNLGTEFPATPGIYAINVRVFETNEYNYISTFRWFKLEEAPTQEVIMVDAVFTEVEGGIVFGGFVDSNGNTVEVDSSLYSVYYELNEAYAGDRLPIEPGDYVIVVKFVDGSNYEFITKNREDVPHKVWSFFKIEATV